MINKKKSSIKNGSKPEKKISSSSKKLKTPIDEKQSPESNFRMEGELSEKYNKSKKFLEITEKFFIKILHSNGLKFFFEKAKKKIPSFKSFDLKKAEERITSFFSICIRLLSFVALISILTTSMKGILDEAYMIDTFKVPEEFEKDGLEGSEVSSRVMSKIRNIQLQAAKSEDTLHNKTENKKITTKLEFDFNKTIAKEDVVIMGVSLHSIKQILRNLFGVENKIISGSIIKRTKELELSLRITGAKEAILVRSEIKENDVYKSVDELIDKIGLDLLKNTDPVLTGWYILESQGEEKLIDYCNELIEKEHPDSKELYVIWGMVLYRKEQYSESIEKFKKAKELGIENNVNHLYFWGASLFYIKDYNSSTEMIEKILEFDSDNKFVYLGLGIILSKQDKKEEAIEKIKKAIEFDPNFALAYFNWGNVLNDLNKKEEAIEKFTKALEIKPNYAYALGNLSQIYFQLKQKELGIKYLNLAFEKNKKKPNSKLELELWFYSYTHVPENRKVAKREILNLLSKKIVSENNLITQNIEIAIKEGHPEPIELKRLAKEVFTR